MNQNYEQIHETNVSHQSTVLPTSSNIQRRLSIISQIYLPYGDEYHRQQRIPPAGPEFQQEFLVERVEKSNGRRFSIISQVYRPLEKDFVGRKTKKYRRILFLVEPIISGLILFPIVVLFWQCGWNVISILLNLVNGYPADGPQQFLGMEESKNLANSLPLAVSQKSTGKEYSSSFDKQFFTQLSKNYHKRRKQWKGLSHPHPFVVDKNDSLILNLEEGYYSFQSLIIPYVTVEIFLLCFYLGQDVLYNYLKRQNKFIEILLLKCHIFLLASIYIVQWEMIWIIWDQYTFHQWYFELLLSLTCLFALIMFIGHLSDLVCAPFLVSYDSIEYCVQFGCPLQTRKMKQWKINLINFVLYEIIISNITIIIWRGFCHFIDEYIYPDDWIRSVWICLLLGYILYFLLMYFQNYFEDLNFKYQFWTFVSINFPQFYRNIRHLLVFFSCLFLWRAFWILYDAYIDIFEFYYQTYLFFYVLSFLFLALIQTASSTNGPLSNMEDENRFFPLYPNVYVSIVVRKISQLSFFRSENAKQTIQP